MAGRPLLLYDLSGSRQILSSADDYGLARVCLQPFRSTTQAA